ncbi:hypothetical protein [Rubinisphaera sp. JC750]|uniref:hypothetical protein n=1 Tax=Rubinisphaera sp. JC750 TaxID=2898658 RepID=UPI001F4525BC|nr:hypothetical protein [Rubinisphaera sp. JC750]
MRLHEAAEYEARPIRVALVERQPELLEILEADARLQVSSFSGLPALLETVQQPDFELIVILQSYPDQFPPADVERLIVRFPLARIICAFETLCLADGRRREIWPLAVRVPSWGLPERLEREVAVLRKSAASLPLTATREEIVRFDSSLPCLAPDDQLPGGLIYSGDPIWAETLRCLLAECTRGDWQITAEPGELPKEDSLQCIIDVDPLSRKLQTQLTELLHNRSDNGSEAQGVILVTSFPWKTKRFLAASECMTAVVDRLNLSGILSQSETLTR